MKPLSTILFFIVGFALFGQNPKKAISDGDYDSWKSATNGKISNNGAIISYEINPQVGDGFLHFKSRNSALIDSIARGKEAKFSPNSDFVCFGIEPQYEKTRKAKLAKKSKDQLPKDTLAIYRFSDNNLIKIANGSNPIVAIENSSWIAYQINKSDSAKKDSLKTATKKLPKNARKPDVKLTTPFLLVLYNPITEKEFQFKDVVEYDISRNGKSIAFIRQPKDTLLFGTVFLFNTITQKLDSLYSDSAIFKKVVLDNLGNRIAFFTTSDTASIKRYKLLCTNVDSRKTVTIADSLTKNLMKNSTPNEAGKLYFSRNDNRLFFGTIAQAVKAPKDTLLEEEKVHLDIWHYKDPVLQPQQWIELTTEQKRDYLAVYNFDKKMAIQLADSTIPTVRTLHFGDSEIALGISNSAYRERSVYELSPGADIYTIDVNSGKQKLLLKDLKSTYQISPLGKYLVWFNISDSVWYATNTKTDAVIALTKDLDTHFFNSENDIPSLPETFGIMGWSKDEATVYIYDKFDIWKCYLAGKTNPMCATKNEGRKNNIVLRHIKTDEDELYITENELLLSGFNKTNKQSSFYRSNFENNSTPLQLLVRDKQLTFVAKAKNSLDYLIRQSSFADYPDYYYANSDMQKVERLSYANPQQKEFKWGSVEIVNWTDFNGKTVSGLLYKPEDWDSTKKYPAIVYFYETHSDELHKHNTPSPSRSIINPTVYTSNGYIVFMPDIAYTIGYPGESAYNAVVSGTMSLIAKGLIDKSKIGLQGQSWGGYQVAYLVTRTNLFACASPGAPVSNMISAYGGIRWESGMSRMYQYEQSQSRIGGTLWEKPFHFIENSPIFYVPKIQTPLLIRHSDNDGAVPWYQSIELFMALKRLNKPAWLINYNNGGHNLTTKRSEQMDWTKRMEQFFDHYLKDAPAPSWMTDGIPATKKGKDFGFEVK